jgi:antitoxin HigA-1
MKNPPHPGRIVRQECLEATGLSVSDAAKALGVSRNAMSELVDERRCISPEMAIRKPSAALRRYGRVCNSIMTWRRP